MIPVKIMMLLVLTISYLLIGSKCLAGEPEENNDDSSMAEFVEETQESNAGIAQMFVGGFFQKLYPKIEAKLKASLNSDEDPNEILAAVERMANEERARGLFKNDAMLKALEQIAGFRRIREGNMCNKNSRAIIWKNGMAIGPIVTSPLSNIKALFMSKVEEHSQFCKDKYPDIFGPRYATFDSFSKRSLEDIFNNIIMANVDLMNYDLDTQVEYNSQYLFDTYIAGPNPFPKSGPSNGLMVVLYHHLLKLIHQDDAALGKKYLIVSDNREIVNLVKSHEVIKKYIVQPCERYIQEFKDIFETAQYDMRVLVSKDEEFPVLEKDKDFFAGWTRFRMCNSMDLKKFPAYFSRFNEFYISSKNNLQQEMDSVHTSLALNRIFRI